MNDIVVVLNCLSLMHDLNEHFLLIKQHTNKSQNQTKV